jgi:hypothetical protein
MLWPSAVWSEEGTGTGPLRAIPLTRLHTILPAGTHLLIDSAAIESFLIALDGTPPDWVTVYGHGHHDPGHDDRLFNLNRERDAKREGNPALTWRVAFIWSGELSRFDSESGGYAVAVGPNVIPTSWGVVRFKPEDVPGNLRAIPDRMVEETLRRRVGQQENIELFVVMVGQLIPQESIVYDFSHDQEGLGLIMPVVRVEHIEYVLK